MQRTFRRGLLTILAALALVLVGAGSSYAAPYSLPGQDASWSPENVGFGGPSGPFRVSTPTQIHETYTRDGSSKVEVWRGFDNQVWVSVNAGQPFTIGATTTYWAPTVVAIGTSGAAIFHTGTDGRIYYVFSNGGSGELASPYGWTNWTAVPGQTTSQGVAATPVGDSGNQVFLAYRGNTNENIYTDYTFDITTLGNWQGGNQIPGIESPSAPDVTYNDMYDVIELIHRGIDNNVYTGFQQVGSNSWDGWYAIPGATTDESPSIALVDVPQFNYSVNMAVFTPSTSQIATQSFSLIHDLPDLRGRWIGEGENPSGWSSNGSGSPTFERETGPGTAYILLTGIDNFGYNQRMYSDQ